MLRRVLGLPCRDVLMVLISGSRLLKGYSIGKDLEALEGAAILKMILTGGCVEDSEWLLLGKEVRDCCLE